MGERDGESVGGYGGWGKLTYITYVTYITSRGWDVGKDPQGRVK